MAKMVKCKACGKEIAKSAKKCPYCGAKQHKGVGAACGIIVIITIVLIFAVLAGSGDKTASTPQSGNQGEQTATQPEKGTGAEKLICDESGLKIYFLGFEKAPYPAIGYYINLRIENTSDIDHTVQVRDVSADGIMVPFGNAIFSGEVLAGKTLNDHVWITNTEQLGITELMSSVELKFVIYDNDDITDGLTTDAITIE